MATREEIQEYLDIRDKIDVRVNAVLNKNVSIDTIPEGEEKNMIKLTVEIVKRKRVYLQEKELYETAIDDYKEEELWQHLKSLVEQKFISCSCRACFLLESSLHAYKYLKRWKIDEQRYPLWYLLKAASIEWIQRFEMRHRGEISDLCKKSCNKTCSVAPVEPVCSTSTSNQNKQKNRIFLM
ncbi:uncharacterized protein LOC115235294 [Formica exsecta]|uniref:uncharacterized protein LOC115235294 n=1 Tax=Formica exsecta TaxID=72781 RepID=UPI00114263AC|nr:uncharacterized protein LOC115235294 [Formica exsecta]